MKNILVRALAFFACFSFPAARVVAATLPEMTTQLQRLQVKIAAGDKPARIAHLVQLRSIGDAIRLASAGNWKNAGELNAALVYLLSGGQPRDLAKLLQGGAVPKDQERLVRGALAYVLGREEEAFGLLVKIDPKSLDLSIAGQFAFILSVLQTKVDVERSIGLLDLARLLAPGGLVEESALRREVLLVGENRNPGRFFSLARQYLARFPLSPYNKDFKGDLAASILKNGLADERLNFDQCQSMAVAMDAPDRIIFNLSIARGAVLEGKSDVAKAAASAALTETIGGSAEQARGQLYLGAGKILGQIKDDGVAELQSVAMSKLDARDKALLVNVRLLVTGVHSMLASPDGSAEQPADELAGSDPVSMTINEASAALARSARLLSAEPTQ